MTLAGFMAGILVLALAIALLSAKLDDRIYDEVDLERVDILPIVGVIPRAELPPKR
jgi:capsular polysaccharide biosynthesis protein